MSKRELEEWAQPEINPLQAGQGRRAAYWRNGHGNSPPENRVGEKAR